MLTALEYRVLEALDRKIPRSIADLTHKLELKRLEVIAALHHLNFAGKIIRFPNHGELKFIRVGRMKCTQSK